MIETISPDDTMFHGETTSYFENAYSALLAVDRALFSAGVDPASVQNVLDFGAGYGRVLRALKSRFPAADITAADVIPKAVEFCQRTFGATPVLSQEDLTRVKYERPFDVIWVGSVFTHLDKDKCIALFDHLTNALAPGGVLVFTTHGRTALWVLENFHLTQSPASFDDFHIMKGEFFDTGFGYVGYSAKHMSHLVDMQGAKLTSGSYGLSCCSPGWISDLVVSREDLLLLSVTEAGWAYNHDVVSVLKPKKPRILTRETPQRESNALRTNAASIA